MTHVLLILCALPTGVLQSGFSSMKASGASHAMAFKVGLNCKSCFFAVQKPAAKTPDDDDPVVVGLPDGEPPPLPDRVRWDLSESILAKTSKRERYNLSGFWRFAAVDEQESVKRSEMGWIGVPTLPTADGTNVFDSRFRDCDGLWHGKPLDKFPCVWVERDIVITNTDVIDWLNRRTYLILSGAWADAEVYASQRIGKRAADRNADAAAEVYVNVEPVTGVDRDGSRICDITEQLIYPGTTQISLRIKRAATTTSGNSSEQGRGEPSILLERWPTGPRIAGMRLRRDDGRRELEATLDLVRPKAFMLVGQPPLRLIPLTLKVRLEPADSNEALASVVQDVEPLAELERTVTLRIPLSKLPATQAKAGLRLRAQLSISTGGVFDEPFPLEFRLPDLEAAERP